MSLRSVAVRTVCAASCWTSTRRRPIRLKSRGALGRCWSSTSRSTPTRATRAGSRRRPMNATSGRSAVICSTGRDAALGAVRRRRRATRWRSPLCLWRASTRRRLRGRGVRTCLLAGVSKPTRDQAWSVLSAALSWAASSYLVPEIQTNGCGLANEPRVNRRRSMRAGGTGYAPARRRRGLGVASWALSPQAVEAIRAQMLLQVNARREILAHRDAMVVSLQYGLGARNQEVWGLRWASLVGEFAWVMEVLSSGELTEWGKTEHSTQRRTVLPGVLREDLVEWRAALRGAGHPARELDFIIPGDLSGPGHGALDSRTGASHFSENQARSWGARFFTPAVEKVAQRPELFPILGATPYSLRRGGISLRLRAEDPQTVASECGTSLKMLSDHYAFAIEDLRRHGPRPVDIEWRAARAAQADHDSREQALRDATEHEDGRGRRKLFAWFAARGRASRVPVADALKGLRSGPE